MNDMKTIEDMLSAAELAQKNRCFGHWQNSQSKHVKNSSGFSRTSKLMG